MTEVYVVTQGDYSDYRIRAIFSRRETADAYVAEIKRNRYEDGAEVEVWPLDTQAGARMAPTWYVTIDLESGDVTGPREDRPSMVVDRQAFEPIFHGRRTASVRSSVSGEHALKLAAEVRQRWLREQAGGAGHGADVPTSEGQE